MKKKIVRREIEPAELSGNLHPLLQRIYGSRGITCMTELEKGLEHLSPYQLLANIEQAVSCLVTALREGQRIMVIGDFDSDGATSTALAVKCLAQMGAHHVSYLVPNRFEYGYGLTPEIVEVAALQRPDLLITVDNGISSYEGVQTAKDKGFRVIITDHHLPGLTLPPADAIVNPNLPGDPFPSKNLAGVGVIFYVMLALRAALRESNWFKEKNLIEPNMASFLDLVALGTVADVVPLDKNNRILVHQGLLRIRSNKVCAGIKALLQVAGKNNDKLSPSDLGYAVAPRLNAAGRLDDMSIGIECLLSENLDSALAIAQQLEALNKERQVIEAEMRTQAFAELAKIELQQRLPYGLALYDATWHQGIIGILASRVKDLVHRPVFAFAAHNEEQLKGSGRSIKGLHLKDVLERIAATHPNLLLKFGGHAMAAGVSILTDRFEEFSAIFNEMVAQHLTEADLEGVIHTDGELLPETINLETVALLHAAGPWGQEFPEPLFDGYFRVLHHRVLKEKHLKLVLGHPELSFKVDAVAFNTEPAKLSLRGDELLHVAYRLDLNEYRGGKNVQLMIEYFDVVS